MQGLKISHDDSLTTDRALKIVTDFRETHKYPKSITMSVRHYHKYSFYTIKKKPPTAEAVND